MAQYICEDVKDALNDLEEKLKTELNKARENYKRYSNDENYLIEKSYLFGIIRGLEKSLSLLQEVQNNWKSDFEGDL